MESIPDDCVLKFHPDTLEAVRKDVGLENPVRMNEAINILEDWVKKQSHFNKKDFPRRYLEIAIVISKGLVERTKQRMDRLCTFKTMMPEFFVKLSEEEISELRNVLCHGHMPKLTKEQYRVYILKMFNTNFDYLMKYYRNAIMFAEYLMKNEYSSGFQIIFDIRECNIMQLISKLNPVTVRQIVMVLTEGYGWRVKGVHLISSSKTVDALITLLKQLASAKLAQRISSYNTIEPLSEFIPKNIMPVEYGGSEKSLKEINGVFLLADQWFKAVSTREFQEYFEDMSKANTDESRRQSSGFNEEYAGMPGSFRALVVD